MSSDPQEPRLRGQNFKIGYRSDDEDDVVNAFFVPALQSSMSYCRAVGFFSSSGLALVAAPVQAFVERGGKVQIIASPRLELDDIADIERGYEIRQVLERATLRALQVEENEAVLRGLGYLGQLIARGALDIKLAVVSDGRRVGMYHEKIGCFRDRAGDVVAFRGSSNETYSGLMLNFESIEVYRSWLPGDEERVLRTVEHFDALWNNSTPRLQVLEFPDVARDILQEYAQSWGAEPYVASRVRENQEPATTDAATNLLSIPQGLVPRDYQRSAMRSWLEQGGRGILKLATGTGKTKTAMFAASHLARIHAGRDQPLVVVVVAPYQHLVDQWCDEIRDFGVQPIQVYEASSRWKPLVQEALAGARLGHVGTVVLVVTNASLALSPFQELIGQVDVPMLLIGDEAHNLGAPTLLRALPRNATYRLGLSATPERWFDEVGTSCLLDYFGAIAYELGLERAIELGALCRYRYYPRLVELDEDEMGTYSALSAKIASAIGAQELDNPDPDSPLGLLLRRRAGVLGHARGKLDALRRDLSSRLSEWFQLVYCAEGYPMDEDGQRSDDKPQVARVIELIGKELGATAHSYVSQTSRQDRRALLRRFESGKDLRFLVAMRCLDEGVDIPDARVGYLLASSSNPRQFIQRRGRLLRKAPGKTHADIYDYIAVPSEGRSVCTLDQERRLLGRELARAAEFGRLSANGDESLRILRPIKEKYGLLDL